MKNNQTSETWTSERLARYARGFLRGKYLEEDPETMQLINKMSQKDSSQQVYDEIKINSSNSLIPEEFNFEDFQTWIDNDSFVACFDYYSKDDRQGFFVSILCL